MLRTVKLLSILGLLALAVGCEDKNKKVATAPTDDVSTGSEYAGSSYGSGSYGPETAGSSTYSTAGSTSATTPAYTPTDTSTSYTGAGESVSAAPPAAGGNHVVAKGESLYSIARLYYNDQHRWRDIYNANKASIRDPNHLKVGQTLVIP